MKIVFTYHAENRLEFRNILKHEVLDAIKRPLITVKKHGKYYAKKELGRGVIEVVYERKENYIKVLTIYWL